MLRENFGEFGQLDFKQEWPNFVDVAKHVLAMANSGGGALVMGVAQERDNILTSKGLSQIHDKTDIDKAIKNFVPQDVRWETLDFSYPSDCDYSQIRELQFQVVVVEYRKDQVPHLSIRAGKGINAHTIYVRRGTETTVANHGEVQNIFSKRTMAVTQSFANDLDDLEALYIKLNEHPFRFRLDHFSPTYKYRRFLEHCIEKKEEAIRRSIGI